MVNVSDVRKRLNYISSDLLPDDVIMAIITDVSNYVDYIKSTNANSELVELCKLMGTCYHALLTYATAIERKGRAVTTSILTQMAEFKVIYEELKEVISRSEESTKPFWNKSVESYYYKVASDP